jgi:HlyD family secretion protein
VSHRTKLRSGLALIAIGIAAGGAAWLTRRAPQDEDLKVSTGTVERRDIALTVEATGTVEPVDMVEVKSKASGTIVTMPVSVGSRVAAGDLLVQIDARDVRNQYDQALAARQAAQVKVEVSGAQKARADSLYAQGIITARPRCSTSPAPRRH